MKKIFMCTWTIIMIIFTVSCGKDESRSGHVEIRLFSENNANSNNPYTGENIRNVQIETVNGWKYIKPISTENNKYNKVVVNESGFGLRWNYDDVRYQTNENNSFEGDRIEYYETRLYATSSKRDFYIKMDNLEAKAEIIKYSYYSGSNSDDAYPVGTVSGKKIELTREDFSRVKVKVEGGITNVKLYLPYLIRINKEGNITSPYSEEPEFFKNITSNNSEDSYEVLNKEMISKDLFGMNKESKIVFKTNDGIERTIDLSDKLLKNTSYEVNLINNKPYYEIVEVKGQL